MKTRKMLCPVCGERMRRKHGYKKAIYNARYAYRTVYECKTCGEILPILTLDEAAYAADRKELLTSLKQAEQRILALESKLREYRDKTNVNRFMAELDALDKQMKFIRQRLKKM